MGVGSMTPRLHPLQAGGGRSSGLPYGFPSLVSSRFTPGLAFWDDFFSVSVGSSSASDWTLTQVGSAAGSAGLASASNSSSALTAGVFQLSTGTTANDLALAELSQRIAGTNTILPVSVTTENGGFTAMFRLAFGATRTTCKHGCGLINNGITNGTDWITDPNTTLSGVGKGRSLIIHRHTSAYGSGGTAAAAGDVVARYYDEAGTDQMVTLVAAASVTANPVKVEFTRAAGSTTITCYVNGASVGTFTTSTSAMNLRPSFGVITETTTARVISLDAMWLEAGTASPAR